ncbi:MAG: transcriptional coactivator p15/PC4 family protein [Nanoarchaeota archaeon]|nr:transcriptional coactivator p15/PC4 family protein [Nanoarchaeota archaeon]
MEKEIGKILKGEYQGTVTEIVVGLREYNGKTGVDIREFTQSETYTGPTKKGLRIPADKFEDFREMINSINPKDLQGSEPATQKKLSEAPEEDSGIDEGGLM